MLDIRRRQFITLLVGAAAAAWPLGARAEQSALPVVGFLRNASLPEPEATHRVTAFHRGMKETGYIEGQNVAIEYRSAEGQSDRLPLLVADLLRRQVALIVGNTPSAVAAKAATQPRRCRSSL
jgi:putative ABC transport system substrate-binding protein